LGESSPEVLRSLVAAAPVALYTLAPDGSMTSCNPAAERLFGASAAALVGRPPPRTPEGARSAPLLDAQGRPAGTVVCVPDDPRDRARAHQLQVILDAIPAPIFYKDADGIYSGCNDAFTRYLGRPREQIVGMSVYDVAPKDLADIYRKADLELLASRDVQIYESSVRYADGSRHDVIFNKATFLDADGQLGGLVGTILDITARKQAERALAASEERYRAAVSALEEGIVVISAEGKLLACNPAAERIFAAAPAELEARLCATSGWWIEGEDGAPTATSGFPVVTTLASGEPAAAPAIAFDRADGTRVWLSLHARALFHPGETAPFAVVASFADISDRRRAEERLQSLAFHDTLTGLPNRALFMDRLAHAIARSTRTGEPFAVACLDLDRFKLVNDTLGHHAGDRLLCDVATRLERVARHSDTVARMGGDEFMAILPGIGDAAGAEAAARRLLDALRPALDLEGHEVRVAASVGMTLYPQDGGDVATLMRHADRAMYRAKDAGRNGFRRFEADDARAAAQAPSRLELESRLHHAIERAELLLHYQPQIELASGEVRVIEALLRWQSPELGLVLPARLVPLAEEAGIMGTLDEWALAEACRQMAAWVAAGRAPGRIAVNVSPAQFRRDDFVAQVERALAGAGLAPERLELELTEAAVMRDLDAVIPRLAALRALRVTVALDDFGAGHSSLVGLRRLHLDTLKLDPSFLLDLDGHAEAPRSVLPSVLGLARGLGLSVVAEGVETAAQLERLRELGCDRVQGFAVARPGPAAAARRPV
jgi:diguanylate cyclase (GGDEF)-like protein/PAS domain S-box-containing protein